MKVVIGLAIFLTAVLLASGCDHDTCQIVTPCGEDSDCGADELCNEALSPPMCQGLFCGDDGSVCSDDRQCLSGRCAFRQCIEPECVPNCGLAECGLDPVCGTLDCGTCVGGLACMSGECVTVTMTDEMGLVPAGPFRMGCNLAVDMNCYDNELPLHEVTLSSYFMDRTEVTQASYKACVDAGVCDKPGCNWHPDEMPEGPVGCVSWHDATTYCAWVGKRLPTEAEWEKAARGVDARIYPWGNEPANCSLAVMNYYDYGCGSGGAWDVCSKSPAGDSPYGMCDMAGNLWEWVFDLYGYGYYSSSPASNPTGPVDGWKRVLRGGGFKAESAAIRVSIRASDYPSEGSLPCYSFRCARDAQ